MPYKAIIISLLSGAFVTSLAEYIFRYNLVDLVFTKLARLFGKAASRT